MPSGPPAWGRLASACVQRGSRWREPRLRRRPSGRLHRQVRSSCVPGVQSDGGATQELGKAAGARRLSHLAVECGGRPARRRARTFVLFPVHAQCVMIAGAAAAEAVPNLGSPELPPQNKVLTVAQDAKCAKVQQLRLLAWRCCTAADTVSNAIATGAGNPRSVRLLSGSRRAPSAARVPRGLPPTM